MQAMKKIHSFDEVFDSQRMFRLILTAMSNPTRRVDIKPFADKLYGENPGFLAVAMTLLDNEVTFSAGDEKLSEEIIALTLSKKTETEDADCLFVSDRNRLENAIRGAKCGTLSDPQKSATIIVKNAGENISRLCLYGAGIDGTTEFLTTELVKAALDIRDSQSYEYPQGIDFIFVSEDGELFAIPRLTRQEKTQFESSSFQPDLLRKE